VDIEVLDNSGKKSSSVVVEATAFEREFNSSLVNQVVVAYMAAGRSGTKAQKNRSAVSGGGKKPFKQKGTGRARAGTTRSPIWRSGGVTFAAQPRSYAQKVNKKMYKGAISVIFSELLRSGRLKVVESLDIAEAKTKQVVELMSSLGTQDALFISEDLNENLYLAARNLYHAGVCDASSIDPVSLIGFDNVVITKDALKKIEESIV
jgi:large subunit ribosomal protein L4